MMATPTRSRETATYNLDVEFHADLTADVWDGRGGAAPPGLDRGATMGCLIRLDPDELVATAAALRAQASELADIGTGVQGQCCSCCLPIAIEGQIVSGASAVESMLRGVATDLGAAAVDLDQRGAVAANDSLPTAGAVAETETMTIGGLPAGMTLEELSAEGAPTIVDGSGGLSLQQLSAMGDQLMANALPSSGANWKHGRFSADFEASIAATLQGRGGTGLGLGPTPASSLTPDYSAGGNAWVVPSISEIHNDGDPGDHIMSRAVYLPLYPGGLSEEVQG